MISPFQYNNISSNYKLICVKIASAEEEKAAAAEAAARIEKKEELQQQNDLERRMEEAATDIEIRMEAVFVAYEITSTEEEKSDAADASALRCG